jgi:hypothetical protein
MCSLGVILRQIQVKYSIFHTFTDKMSFISQ